MGANPAPDRPVTNIAAFSGSTTKHVNVILLDENIGRTPAYDANAEYRLRLYKHPENLEVVVKVSEFMSVIYTQDIITTENLREVAQIKSHHVVEMETPQNRDWEITLIGRIDYVDQFEEKRWSKFGFRVIANQNHFLSRFQSSADEVNRLKGLQPTGIGAYADAPLILRGRNAGRWEQLPPLIGWRGRSRSRRGAGRWCMAMAWPHSSIPLRYPDTAN